MVEHLSDEQLQQAAPRRPRPGEGLRRLQGRRRAQGRADRHPGQDDQGLRPGRSGRGQEHHPPAEEAQRGRAARVPHPLRHPDLRRGGGRGAVLPAARGQRRDAVPARAARGARRLPCPARRADARRCRAARRALFDEFHEGTGDREVSTTMAFVRMLAKLLRDKEHRQARSCRSSPTRRAPSAWSRCSARCGIYSHVGPALRAGRHGHAALLQGSARTGRSSKRASPRPARCPRSSPPAPPTPPTAST